MGAEDEAAAEGGGGDKRLEWMENRVVTTLKVKKEKFKELMGDEVGMYVRASHRVWRVS